jgi:hypothetical protein
MSAFLFEYAPTAAMQVESMHAFSKAVSYFPSVFFSSVAIMAAGN